MAGTRRSTRQTTCMIPKYTESSSSSDGEEVPKRGGAKATNTTRRKRVREKDGDARVKADDRSRPEKARKLNLDDSASPMTKSNSTKTAPPTLPSPNSNRDANGEQEIFWLLKAEPLPRYENGINVAFSIDDLAACTLPEPWTGVRNPQARNNMQAMRKGDLGFFYHSNAKPSGIVGVLQVVEEAKVDETAFDAKDPYYDPKSTKDKPKWYCVGVKFIRKFSHIVDLHTIKNYAQSGGPLEGMQLVTNSRLSVSRVSKKEWEYICGLAEEAQDHGQQKTDRGAEDQSHFS